MDVLDVLIVEDDDEFRAMARQWLARHNHRVEEVGSAAAALDKAAQRQFDVAIVDLRLPDLSGVELLPRLQAVSPETEVIILTGQATVATAVEAMKCGAYDYLAKPFPLTELEARCRKAAEHGRLRKQFLQWKALAERNQAPSAMIGESPPMQEVRRLIERIGPTDKPVLIQGETGTGKELAARAVQRASLRADRPFVVINCAALPEHLVESELFGHQRGAFTGAVATVPGLFEMADGGTLFIDEIGELPLSLQPKLLRVLEDGSLRRVGATQERRVDVRIIAATNRDLAREVNVGRFREDLLYRINVLSLNLPPLRERPGDLPLLLAHFLPPGWTIAPKALAALERYHWPGNVRQLRNVLERAVILAEAPVVTLDDLPDELQPRDAAAAPFPDGHLSAVERSHVRQVLQRCGGNKSEAARALGIHRRKLYRLLDRWGLNAEDNNAEHPRGMSR
jgi:DNA-binding NtrC family response regulator